MDMSKVYERFLGYLPKLAKILDARSGSGRDTLAFKKHGHEVDAFDAAPELCALSTELTGVPMRLEGFQEFETEPLHEGIWACASLLHVQAGELPDVFHSLVQGLKPGVAFYSSFKHGLEERCSADGRFFQDLDEAVCVPCCPASLTCPSTKSGILTARESGMDGKRGSMPSS